MDLREMLDYNQVVIWVQLELQDKIWIISSNAFTSIFIWPWNPSCNILEVIHKSLDWKTRHACGQEEVCNTQVAVSNVQSNIESPDTTD